LNQNLVSFHQADLLAPGAVDLFLSWLDDDGERNSGGANCSSSGGKGQTQRYNLITSNPPYIAHSEYETLEPEVAQWEDPKALLADQEGLVFYPRIANMAIELLHRQPAAPQSSSSSSSSGSYSSNVAAEGQNTKHFTRELDPRTLERMDSLDHDEQQYRNNSINNNSRQDSNGRTQEDKEEVEDENVERTWRNGPELDRVKIPELVFEIGGDHQVDFVSAAVRQAGFRRVQVWKDLADRARCIVGAR
jgi:methylase of polypeptide subunit release factors